MPKQLKIALISLAAAIGVLLLAVAAYVLYVYLQYYRIDDGQILTVSSEKTDTVRTGKTYSVMTYNIGFGAYGPDFSFFMDSGVMDTGEKKTGRYGKAIDRQSVTDNIAGSVAAVRAADCDFVLLQEVDSDGSRSYHVDQVAAFTQDPAYASVYAVNFHTAYLFWPLNDPHGKNESGILTLTKYAVSSAVRRSYPVSTSFDKFFDLDRCFSVMYLPVSDSDRQLVLVNSHMSAYDEGGTIRAQQLAMLNAFMAAEREKGNYVIVGGDFNHDIAASDGLFPSRQQHPDWVFSLTDADLPEGFRFAAAVNAPTCRAAEIPYEKGINYTVVVDGFIVSDNVDTVSVENIDLDFRCSDHNPAVMQFVLKAE